MTDSVPPLVGTGGTFDRARDRDAAGHVSDAQANRAGRAGYAGAADSTGDDAFCRLTPRELLVLQLLALGYTETQIALLLDCSRQDVQEAVASALSTLAVDDVTTAITIARRRGILS